MTMNTPEGRGLSIRCFCKRGGGYPHELGRYGEMIGMIGVSATDSQGILRDLQPFNSSSSAEGQRGMEGRPNLSRIWGNHAVL